jgi:hypothetical protein
MKSGAEAGAMPANVSVSERATVTAGFANEVEAVNHVLFALGGLAFASAYLGRRAMRRRWPNWAGAHLTGMGLSYILLVTAFYVDNGKNLPLWRRLPAVAYWLLPGLVGVPIIVNAYWRHPLVRQPASKSSADA